MCVCVSMYGETHTHITAIIQKLTQYAPIHIHGLLTIVL